MLAPSSLRCRWIYWKPLQWFALSREMRRAQRLTQRFTPDLWMTYHSYYKAPDMLGPCACRRSASRTSYSRDLFDQRRRDIRTGPGFLLNRRALRYARHIFTTDGRRDQPAPDCAGKPSVVRATGNLPGDFVFDPEARGKRRRSWDVGESPVVLSAAMFRPDVKTEGLAFLIRACGKLFRNGLKLHLAIAGDGKERPRLEKLAREHLPGRAIFAGKNTEGTNAAILQRGRRFRVPGNSRIPGDGYLEASRAVFRWWRLKTVESRKWSRTARPVS